MTASTLERTAPGWYKDPSGLSDLRWFDGAAWTARTQPAAAAAPVAPRPATQVVASSLSGWYPDPAGSPLLRFFDGQRWTEKVAPPPATPAVPPAPAPAALSAPVPASAPAVSIPAPAAPAELRAPVRRLVRTDSQTSPLSLPVEDLDEATPARQPLMRRVGTLMTLVGVAACLYVAWVLVGSNIWADWEQRNLREEIASQATAPVVTPTEGTVLEGSPLVAAPGPAPSAAAPSAAPAPALPADGTGVGTIRIPSIGVDVAFVAGTEVADLKKGPGVWRDGSFPGQPGNAVIAGHRTTYGAPFRRLNELKTGDRIIISVPGQPDAVYEVRGQEIVAPSAIEVTYQTSGVRLTLTTCEPVGSDAKRLIIQAELVEGANVDKALPAAGWTFQK